MGPGVSHGHPRVESVDVGVYVVPTDQLEADGTLEWSSTTMVVVEVRAGGQTGLGWTYAGPSAATVIHDKLADVCVGADPSGVPRLNEAMARACRNLGRSGVVACAISAVDVALWDLKARLLGVSLTALFGQARADVPVYGSGGFTTYDNATTWAQLERWVGDGGIPRVKIKIGESWGADPGRDLARVDLAREVVGDDMELYVDANGGYGRKQAVRMGRRFVEDHGVVWFEEPVSSDDLDGLREVRDNCAADIAAGKYGYRRSGPQHRGPQPGHLGAASHGGRPPLRRLAGHPRGVLCRLGRHDRPEGHHRGALRRPRGGLHRGLRRDRPVIVDAMTTPNEPPMPPHVTFDQARALMSSVAKDPKEGIAGAAEGVREMVHELIHPKRG